MSCSNDLSYILNKGRIKNEFKENCKKIELIFNKSTEMPIFLKGVLANIKIYSQNRYTKEFNEAGFLEAGTPFQVVALTYDAYYKLRYNGNRVDNPINYCLIKIYKSGRVWDTWIESKEVEEMFDIGLIENYLTDSSFLIAPNNEYIVRPFYYRDSYDMNIYNALGEVIASFDISSIGNKGFFEIASIDPVCWTSDSNRVAFLVFEEAYANKLLELTIKDKTFKVLFAPVSSEYSYNADLGLMLSSTYPVTYDIGEYEYLKEIRKVIYLQITNIYTMKVENVARKIAEPFSPTWVSLNSYKYKDQAGEWVVINY